MFPRYKIVENFFRIPLTPFPHHLARSIRQVACWKCGTENATNLYCQSCNVLQEPDSKSNYFDLLGISLSYNVQSSDLVSKYHKKQVLFHPDKHSNKSDKEKEISENYSTLINKAYTTLSNPLRRGLYMLKIKGSPIDEEKVATDDREFFVEILNLNDELELVRNGNHATRMTIKLTEKMSQLIKEISQAFEKDDIEKARTLLNQLNYYTNVMNKLKARKQTLGIPG